MRRRILGVAVAAVVLAVTVFGVPLAVAVHALLYSGERGELERLALRGAVSMSPDAVAGDPVELPRTEDATELGIYDLRGRRIAGQGPARADPAVTAALAGRVADRTTPDSLVVSVPVTSGEQVIAAARASAPRSAVRAHILSIWAAMLGLAVVAGGLACLLAAVQARRVNRPLERLVGLARQLGAGNFTQRAAPSGVDEIDRAGEALNSTAAQLDEMMGRERAFSAHASHQLRTPLTSLRLGLETALSTPGADLEAAARKAVLAADQLSRTVDDVLELARGAGSSVGTVDVHQLLDDVRTRWHGPLAALGRPLRTDDSEAPRTARGAEPAVRQILEVLLDNACRHGQGTVTVVARDAAAAVAIDVCDEGSTVGRHLLPVVGEEGADGAGHLGLALAGSLTRGQGGRLLHARTEQRTRFTLLLPRDDAGDPIAG